MYIRRQAGKGSILFAIKAGSIVSIIQFMETQSLCLSRSSASVHNLLRLCAPYIKFHAFIHSPFIHLFTRDVVPANTPTTSTLASQDNDSLFRNCFVYFVASLKGAQVTFINWQDKRENGNCIHSISDSITVENVGIPECRISTWLYEAVAQLENCLMQ